MQEKTKVSVKRHIAKSITWRIVATATTIIVAWIITKEINLSLKIGLAEVFIKTLIYFIHERIWYLSNFGIKGRRHEDLGVKNESVSGEPGNSTFRVAEK